MGDKKTKKTVKVEVKEQKEDLASEIAEENAKLKTKIEVSDGDDKSEENPKKEEKKAPEEKSDESVEGNEEPEQEANDTEDEESTGEPDETEEVNEPETVDEDSTDDNDDEKENVATDSDEVDEKTDSEEDTDELETDKEELDKEQTVEEAIEAAEKTEKTKESNPDIDEAVDDIVRTESDEAIKEADEKIAALNETKSKKSFKQKIGAFFAFFWVNKPVRYGLIFALFALLIAVILMPTTRYTLLNTLGVRVTTSMTVVDSQTRLPLKNIKVSIQDKEVMTTEDGYAAFEGLKLGETELSITKRGYADNIRDITLGWGSNPIGNQDLIATGERFVFVLKDWKSNQPLLSGEAVSGEYSGISDDEGKVTITIGQEDIQDVEITVNAEGYRGEVFSGQELEPEEIEVLMVPSKKHYFVSNRDNQFDLYKVDVDGQNEELVLSASGDEREIPSVLANPNRDSVAFISSRDNEKNSDGFALDGLFIIDGPNQVVHKVTRSEQLQFVGWFANKLVYSQVVEGTSRGNGERSKLFSYDIQTEEKIELASSNYFNDVMLVDDVVYYSVSSFAVPQSIAKLYTIKVDGTEKNKLVDTQVWTIYRKNYNTLVFNAINQEWFEYVIGGEVTESDKQVISSRDYVDSPSGKYSAWVDVRDGQGVLSFVDTSSQNETQLLNMPGLNKVLYWANDSTVVFRVISNSETADYVLNIDQVDPEPVKIRDITATQRYQY